MIRILNPKYYQDDEEKMITSLQNMNVKFIVGGRIDQTTATSRSEFVSGEEALHGLPTDIQGMFLLLDESEFRVDISSTEIRQQQSQQQQEK